MLDHERIAAAATSLSRRPRAELDAASRVVGEVLLAQAEARVGAMSHQRIDARCGELGASDATCEADGVRPIEVLRRGPKNEQERAVVSVLLARYLGEILNGDHGDTRLLAKLQDIDWLEFTGPYQPYEAAPFALAGLGESTASRFAKVLARAPIDGASKRAEEATRALRGLPAIEAPAQTLATTSHTSRSATTSAVSSLSAGPSIAVEVIGHARGFFARSASALLGIGALRAVFSLFGRGVFSFRRPAMLSVEESSLRLVGHSEILGRTLRTWDVRLPLAELIELRREARFPWLPAALSMTGLLLGTLLGARRVIEGAGAKYFPLVALGVGMLLAGIAFELLLRALWPGLTGRVRLLIRSRDSQAIELSNLEPLELDALLASVDRLLAGAPTSAPARFASAIEIAPATASAPFTDVDPGDHTVEDPVRLEDLGAAKTVAAKLPAKERKPKAKP
ncbi:MAG: hypothetical protein Q8Q09_08065 [Deltaproteobacteria bacterium]|nr:hypothetical protein [Deltaproteobacteria bacterium]